MAERQRQGCADDYRQGVNHLYGAKKGRTVHHCSSSSFFTMRLQRYPGYGEAGLIGIFAMQSGSRSGVPILYGCLYCVSALRLRKLSSLRAIPRGFSCRNRSQTAGTRLSPGCRPSHRLTPDCSGSYVVAPAGSQLHRPPPRCAHS